jgi:hypothetical protein
MSSSFIHDDIYEKSTTAFIVELQDESLEIIEPKTAFWQLTKTDGTIINNRSFVNCPLVDGKIVLSGEDLAIFGDLDTRIRVVAIMATYDSTNGIDLPCNKEFEFCIIRMVSVVDSIV